MHQVFVYGTLLSEGSRPAADFVNARLIGPALTRGVLYDLGWFPGFKFFQHEPEWEGDVKGELIEVDDDGLERLDAYEGVPTLYKRREITVGQDGVWTIAYVYEYNGDPHPDDLIPSGSWIEYSHQKENV